MSLIVDEHREYLSDEVRVAAYRAAIGEVVRPGDVVLDLASGSGILGLMACQAGASRVYSVEVEGMIEIIREVARANGFGDRVVAVKGMSTEVTLPERVDTIVCDQIGRFGVEAGLIQHGSDARDRFLKPGGTMVPGVLDMFLAPVESPEQSARVEFWATQPGGFNFTPARKWAVNTGYPIAFAASALLAPAGRVASIDVRAMTSASISASLKFVVERPGMLHGLGGWFSAQLSPGVTLTNAPTAARRINRRNVFFPVDAPLQVEPGDTVDARMHIIPDALTFSWSVVVGRAGTTRARFTHSTLRGMLLSREDLRCMDPRFVPQLTPRGEARLSVLTLSDGTRPLAEIEQEMFQRHPELFHTRSEAQVFVVEVLTRYARPLP